MNRAHYIIPIFVPHKGCPNDCVFCNQKKITGQENETSSKDAVDKIEAFLHTIPAKDVDVEVAFYGGSFTAIPFEQQTELLSAAYSYVCQGRVQHIRVSTRPDCISREILLNLKAYGVKIVELGVQSMDDAVLVESHRGHTSQDVLNAIALLREFDFVIGIQLMVGLPGDSRKKCIETTKKLITLKPDIARIYPALVIRHTHMEELYYQGKYIPLSIMEAAETCKDMLILLKKNNIEVIRIGLQPTDNIALGADVVAGPFHPAMRQMVEALIYRDMLEYFLAEQKVYNKNLTLIVNPKDISNILGQRKSNIIYIKNKFSLDKIFILQDSDIEKEEILMKFGENKIKLSAKDYLGRTVI